jgi:hypothetical protein
VKNLIFALIAILLAAPSFIDNGGSLVMRGIQKTEDFSVTATPKTVIVSGASSSTPTVKDAVVNNYTTAAIQQLSDVNIILPLESAFPATQTISNQTPGVCTFSSTGVSTYAGPGTAIANVTLNGIGTRQITFPCSATASASTVTFNSFVSGSLGAALSTGSTGINTLLAGKTHGTSVINLYTAYDPINGTATRNPSVFTGSLDLSCIPAAIDVPNIPAKWRGCLVSPQHWIGAAHTDIGAGHTLYFCDNSNPGVVTSRTITSSQTIANVNNPMTDIIVCYLNAPVASGIGYAKVLPANYNGSPSYMPSLGSGFNQGYGYPAIYVRQDNNLYVGDLVNTSYTGTNWAIQQSTDATRSLWFSSIITGDSGSPAMMDVGGTAVLLGTWYSSNGATQGYFNGISDNITAINSAMTTLQGSSASLTQISLSYSTY